MDRLKQIKTVITLIWIEVRFDIMSNLTTEFVVPWIVYSQSQMQFFNEMEAALNYLFVNPKTISQDLFHREPFIMTGMKTTNDSYLMCKRTPNTEELRNAEKVLFVCSLNMLRNHNIPKKPIVNISTEKW